jgi:hypothetical protein
VFVDAGRGVSLRSRALASFLLRDAALALLGPGFDAAFRAAGGPAFDAAFSRRGG